MPQIPQSNASLEDVISMPLDFNGLLSALCGDHFDVVDSYAEPNYPHFESTTVVSNSGPIFEENGKFNDILQRRSIQAVVCLGKQQGTNPKYSIKHCHSQETAFS
jgi:hypothetical protein